MQRLVGHGLTDLHLNGGSVMLGSRKTGFLSRDDEDVERIWYISPRRRDKHFFKILKGWGIAVEILEFLEKHDVYGIKLVVDGRELLMSSLKMVRLKGDKVQYEGFEEQIILPEKFWLKKGQVML